MSFTEFINANRVKASLLAIAYVLLLAVIGLQNVPFWDDSLRRLNGMTAWGPWDGRWGSEAIGRLLNSGTPIVDLGLTTFVVSAVVMAAASLVVVWALVGAQATWLTYVLALAFGLNPWILNALAFRFDGPFMALSVLLAVSAIFLYRARPWQAVVGYALSAWAVANFFQSAIGIILTLLMTKLLIDWVQGRLSAPESLVRLGLAFGGVAAGVVAYAGQSRLLGTGRSDWFDLGHPFTAFPNNLYHFLRVFLLDNGMSWLVVTGLVFLIAAYAILRQSQRGLIKPIFVFICYLIISVLASGGVLLFATAEHVSVQARFRFPLAMGIGMLAIVASANDVFPPLATWTPSIRVISQLVLGVFAYLWLATVFLFAGVLGEQQDALRFQAGLIFSEVFTQYRAGDAIVYDPNIFTNSVYSQRVAQRFPIFANPSYLGVINTHSDTVRDRLAELLGLGQEVLYATAEKPGICDLVPADAQAITGARWVTWRADADFICVTFPAVAQIVEQNPEHQTVQLNLNAVPFDATIRPNLWDLPAEQLEMALWSLENPADIQWVTPTSLTDGIARFDISAPAAGWQGNIVVAHFFANGEFVFQQIWQIPIP